MHLRKIRRRAANTLTLVALFPLLYAAALILDWQDRKAGAR